MIMASSYATNHTLHRCFIENTRQLCFIPEAEIGKRDALAGLRLVVSSLSFLGAFSIIYTTIRKKRVCSPKVSPLFVLSIADLLLALLWGVGGVLWLSRTEEMKRGWCLSVSLITIIVECVAINLTFVYALLAYQHTKKLESGLKRSYVIGSPGVLTAGNKLDQKRYAYPLKSSTMYLIAWLLPLVLVMVPFSVVVKTGDYHILDFVEDCSCWCEPAFGNIIPLSVSATNATARYSYEFHKVMLLYAVVISAHYLVVFVTLVTCYMKILRHIQKINKEYNKYQGSRRYGTIKVQIKQAQSRARRRVIAFIIVFIATGFFNLALSVAILQFEIRKLTMQGPDNLLTYRGIHNTPGYLYIIYYIQSLTVPMQGFLNAIVYGWTREDFIKTVVTDRANDRPTSEPQPEYHDGFSSASEEENGHEEEKTLFKAAHSAPAMTREINSNEAQTDFETDEEDLTVYRV